MQLRDAGDAREWRNAVHPPPAVWGEGPGRGLRVARESGDRARLQSCSECGVRKRAHTRREAAIPAPLDHVDRALNTYKPRSRQLSALILVLGMIALAVALYYSPDRQRERAALRVAPGADSAAVLRMLGRHPTRCPAGAMEHLPAAMGTLHETEADSAMAQLRRETRQRWLYPGKHGCTPEKGETELGIDAAGRVLWIQPAAGKRDVRLSPSIRY
jgi:hypothetical protein